MKKIFILLSLIFVLSSCSIDWNWEKDKKIAELEKHVKIIEEITSENIKLPETSFKAHIIQFWWIHSALYDGVFWNIPSLDSPYPVDDVSINDIKTSWIKIDYRWRKDYFEISCPTDFQINNCEINNNIVNKTDEKCYFYFPVEWNKNSDISFTCSNNIFYNPY